MGKGWNCQVEFLTTHHIRAKSDSCKIGCTIDAKYYLWGLFYFQAEFNS